MLKNKKVLVIAAVILVASAAALFTTVGLAQGAEIKKTIVEQSEYGETVSMAAVTAAVSDTAIQQTSVEPSPSLTVEPPAPSSTPGAEYISEDEASSIFTKAALYLFGLKIDKCKPHFETNSDGHSDWSITNKNYDCYIDAISGAVIEFNLHTKYSGKKITQGDFDTPAYSSGIYDDPNNIYITAAKDFVNSKLAKGQTIDNIEVDAMQFVWDNDKGSPDPSEKGTILVDCHVYMHAGPSYTLSFLGTENPELNRFYSYPTQDGCRYDYFYEEDAENYQPSPSVIWNTAPGITAYPTPQPTVTPAP